MTDWNRRSPVRDYTEMAGWPGTIPPGRLRAVMDAIMARTPPDRLKQQTREDMIQLVQSHEANMVSSQPLPGNGGGSREELVEIARSHDTELTIGGIILWKGERSDERSIFRLMRDPEWMGLNRILPLMEGMSVMILESRALPRCPGLVLVQTEWDEAERAGGRDVPEGPPEQAARVIRWHGAREVRWVGG